METFGNKIKQNSSFRFCCKVCDYYTDRKSNIDNHFAAARHIKEINGNNIKYKLSDVFCCEKCKKVYQTNAGLWKHNKKCNVLNNCDYESNKIIDDSEKDIKLLDELFLNSNFPEKIDIELVNSLLVKIRKEFYEK